MASLNEILYTNKSITNVCELHIRQIGNFLFRRGVELVPKMKSGIDDYDSRMELDRFWTLHRTSIHLREIFRTGVKCGEVLLYMVPGNNGGYTFKYYPKSQFEPTYDTVTGRLQQVSIHDRLGGFEYLLTPTEIISKRVGFPSIFSSNPYGFIPCVVIQNISVMSGRGRGDFDDLQSQIETLDWREDKFDSNFDSVSGPIVYSTLAASQLTQLNGQGEQPKGVLEQSGYGIERAYNRRRQNVLGTRSVVGNLQPDDVLGALNIPALDADTLSYVQRYENQIRIALGGLPDVIDQNTLLNSEDVQLRYAPVFATAFHKAEIYFKYGICEIYKMLVDMERHFNPSAFLGLEDISWRYLGDIFLKSSRDKVNDSIVARNMVRFGVNPPEVLRYIFPSLTPEEIDSMLLGGYPYELLNGMTDAVNSLDATQAGALPVINSLYNYILSSISTHGKQRSGASYF